MVLQETDSFPTLKGTYVGISWRKTLRTCTWLWSCAPAEKTLGCTQTAEGTGSHTPRCRWNWCTPADKAHDPGQPWTASKPPEAGGGVIFLQCSLGGSLISVTFWTVQLSLISLNDKWEKNWTADPEQWCKRQMFSHKPLKCFVETQAVTAVIELDEPSRELLLQYSSCGEVRGRGSQVCVTESGW